MTKTLFLPGAAANSAYWEPVASRLNMEAIHFSWPGLGNEPPVDGVASIDDLVRLVLVQMDEPVNVVAQSLGGLIAIKALLERPGQVNRLVLAVTSAGIPVADLGGIAWSIDYPRRFPQAPVTQSPTWLRDTTVDLSQQIRSIQVPTLLLWGDEDSISPIAVGERLHGLLPNVKLHVIAGGDHDLAQTHAPLVADLIGKHLTSAD
jgi:pimeloyl-ACP methyl ester carboxylesterase